MVISTPKARNDVQIFVQDMDRLTRNYGDPPMPDDLEPGGNFSAAGIVEAYCEKIHNVDYSIAVMIDIGYMRRTTTFG